MGLTTAALNALTVTEYGFQRNMQPPLRLLLTGMAIAMFRNGEIAWVGDVAVAGEISICSASGPSAQAQFFLIAQRSSLP